MRRTLRRVRAGLALTLSTMSMTPLPAAAEQIEQARYAVPVARYGHFALGRPHEYADVEVRTDTGRTLTLSLPDDAVFEDLAPRRVQLAPGAPPVLLSIVSTRRAGARLVLLGLQDGMLSIVADGPPIGRPNRWLNPVGVADLDGDGEAEIAAVTTPHIGGVLRVYRRRGDRLVEIAALDGVSNHVYGSATLALSAPGRVQGRPVLLVPDQARTALRAIALQDGRLVEVARCASPRPVDGPAALPDCAARLDTPAR